MSIKEAYCIPCNAGLASEPRAVARRIARLLNTLATEVNEYTCQGQIAEDTRKFRLMLHEKLTAEGWRIRGINNGWAVLPPKEN